MRRFMNAEVKGKTGDPRIIHFRIEGDEQIWLLTVQDKEEGADLTKKKSAFVWAYFFRGRCVLLRLAAPQGFEPRYADPESDRPIPVLCIQLQINQQLEYSMRAQRKTRNCMKTFEKHHKVQPHLQPHADLIVSERGGQ